MTAAAIGLLAAGAIGVLYLWYGRRARRLSSERLAEWIGKPFDEENREQALIRTVRAFPPRHRLAAPALGSVVTAVLWLVVGLPVEVAAAVGVLIGVLTHLIEDYVAEERAAVIEMQLSAAIDLLVGSLRAGASLLAAFESALQETQLPLRPYFQEVAGRIRLGDDPRAVSYTHLTLPTNREV